MLTALADGRALPAGELASVAGLSLSGASAQLARLTQGGLLTMEREGRHRYYRLSGPQVATALEGLALLAMTPRRPRARSPATEALRRARMIT
jgi:DNA-binding transcriptional ArsR family regulator